MVDLGAANRNLQRMAEFAAKHRLRLRPHAKMHKSAEFARLQLQAGAIGLCAQTVAEAEALGAGGVNDVFISNEILAVPKLRRVAALAHQLKSRGGQLAIAVDSFEGVERLAQAMQLTNAVIDVFIELDIGHGRCGVATPEAAVQLAQLISRRSASLRYAGLHAYHGAAQHLRSVDERRHALTDAAARLNAARDRGVNEFLAKPVTARDILKRLESVILRPRPYVAAADFFGPDQRRRSPVGYTGPLRRVVDQAGVLEL